MFYNLPKTAADLPSEIPIFPLTGTILLPQCRVPLNIFEPRYLHMVFDALKEDRLIGMIQPQPESAGELYRIGGAGRITGFEETDDGRVLVQLTGLSRFAVKEEADSRKGYRRIVADWLPFSTDLIVIRDATISSQEVISLLEPFLDAHHLKAEWHSLDRVAGSDLIDVLSMNLPFPAEDKQALLEAPDAHSRFEVLKKVAALYTASALTPSSGARH